MLPTTFKQLLDTLKDGVKFEVNCKKLVEDLESYPEANTRLTIVSATGGDVEDVVRLKVSYEKYDEYNKQYESSNYYDRSQVPCLTARESGFYKVTDELYVMEDSDPNSYFALIPNKLTVLYSTEKQGDESYVQYLERRLTALL